MWFFDSITSGFQNPTDPGRLQLFRIVFATVLTLRFTLSFGQGGWDRFTPDSLSTHLAKQRFGPKRAGLLICSYRPALLIRTAAAETLAVGFLPRLSLVLVLAGAAMELLYLKSPNAVRFTLLTGTCLLLAGDLGHGLHIEHHPSTANTWAQCLLVLVTADIYWNSAWQKLRSPNSAPASTSPSGSTSTPKSETGCPTAANTPSPASYATTPATSPTGTSTSGAWHRPQPSQRRSHCPQRY